jgi:hypothetical protein
MRQAIEAYVKWPIYCRHVAPKLTNGYIRTGHQHGYGPEYEQAVAAADQALATFMQVIKDANVLLLVVSDHGRDGLLSHGVDHGLFTEDELNTLFIAWGPSVLNKVIVQKPTQIMLIRCAVGWKVLEVQGHYLLCVVTEVTTALDTKD